jgi:hypothetical protein
MESIGATARRATVSVTALQRLGGLLQRDENLARKLAKNPRRALAAMDFISDRDKQVLAGINPQFWSQVAAVSDTFQAANSKRAMAGLAEAPVSIATTPGGYNPEGAGAYGFGDFNNLLLGGGGPTPGIPFGGSRGPDLSGAERGDGGPGASSLPGRRGAASFIPGFSSVGIDLSSQGGGPAPPVNRPAPARGSFEEVVAEGQGGPKATQYEQTAYDNARANEKIIDDGPSVGDRAAYRLQRTLEKEAARVVDEGQYDYDKEQEHYDPALAELPPNPYGDVPPPKPDASNPNPEDPNGPRPAGPWARGQSPQAQYFAGRGTETPNPEDPRGPQPAGPWSRGQSRMAGSAFGGTDTPNPEDPRGPRPSGPWSQSVSRGVYTPFGREAFPNPEDPGGRGPVGPTV